MKVQSLWRMGVIISAMGILIWILVGAIPDSSAISSPVYNMVVEEEPSNITSLGTFWQLTAKAGGLRWAIFAVFVIGVFLVAWKLFELYSEWKKAAPLMNLNFRNLTLQEIVRNVEGQPQNILSRIIAALLNLFQSTGSANGLSEEIGNYVKYEQDRFDTFRTRLMFLSDTAGALGLLGTVWGMFLTFFTGNLDKQVIMNGMGIALLTTLLGLVVSIILNLSTTEVYSLFQKILDRIAGKSEELRFRLLELSSGGMQTVPAALPAGQIRNYETAPQVEVIEAEPVRETRPSIQSEKIPAAQKSRPSPVLSQIEVVKSLPSTLSAGQKPVKCEVKVTDQQGKPIAGQSVQIRVLEGSGSLEEEGQQELIIRSDKAGRVEWKVHAGQQVGPLVLQISGEADGIVAIRMETMVSAGAPSKLRILGGNHQSTKIGEKLPRNLKVAVEDRFGNPVSGAACVFSVKEDEGVFPNGKNTVEVATGDDGVAETSLQFCTKPGLVLVHCKLEEGGLKTHFELFAQEE